MKKLTLTLLASAALAMPAMVPAMAQGTTPQPATPGTMAPGAMQNGQQPETQQQSPNTSQNAEQQNPGGNAQAATRVIPPSQLGRTGVRKVQTALNKKGFHAGHADGIWGSRTRNAVQNFQKSRNMSANGQLTQKTLSALGVQVASNQSSNSGQMSPSQSDNPPSQNSNSPIQSNGTMAPDQDHNNNQQ
jgi:Putative peptidoglycan binding domain